MLAATPNPAVIAAILSGSGIVVTITGWFVQHHLTKKREAQRDKKAKDEAVAAAKATEKAELETALHLTEAQKDILRHCSAEDAPMRGYIMILGVSGRGSWVRAGKKDFHENADPSFQERYLEALNSLSVRGYFRREGDSAYRMTALGWERIKLAL